MRIVFSVDAEPVGKGRARFTSKGRPYTPSETVVYERLVRVICQDVMRRQRLVMITGACAIDITIRLVPAKSASKKRRAIMLAGQIFPTKKPDCSNVVKAVEDAINGVAYVDDSQIIQLRASKVYAEACGVDVVVESVSEQAGRDQGDGQGAGLRSGADEGIYEGTDPAGRLAASSMGDP